MIIAIDGPCASGKEPLARRLAAQFGLNYLETGALYRSVGLAVLRAEGDPSNLATAVAITRRLNLTDLDLSNPELFGEEVGIAASKVAAIPEVRDALVDFQRTYAAKPPGAVLDGRDIGTVILPDAQIKVFLTGSIERRVERRFNELLAKGALVFREKVYKDMQERDARDQDREIAPLLPSSGALILDSSDLNDDEIFVAAMRHIAVSCVR